MERDVERQIREAMRQARVAVDEGIVPAVEAVRRHVREMNVPGIIDAATGRAGAVAAAPPATEERLAILRMVEEGKLSPDDAARLLDAL